MSWQECGSPVEIPQQSEEKMRRQRDEALKHCGDMLRALQQVTQAVGEAGNVGPNRARHRASLTDNMEHPYSSEIGPELIGNCNENLLPTNGFSLGGAEGQSIPQGNDFNWYRDNGDYYQFKRLPRLACPEYAEIRGDDRSEYLELPQYHSREDLSRVRDGPFGPGVTCPQVNPSTSPRRGPTWNRPAGNVMPSLVAPQYLPVAGNRNTRKQKEPNKFEGDKVEWADFIAHFEMVARWNDWTYTEKGLQLATCLRGKAQKVLRSIPESQRSDYEAMKSALEKRFSPPHRENAFRAVFRQREG